MRKGTDFFNGCHACITFLTKIWYLPLHYMIHRSWLDASIAEVSRNPVRLLCRFSGALPFEIEEPVGLGFTLPHYCAAFWLVDQSPVLPIQFRWCNRNCQLYNSWHLRKSNPTVLPCMSMSTPTWCSEHLRLPLWHTIFIVILLACGLWTSPQYSNDAIVTFALDSRDFSPRIAFLDNSSTVKPQASFQPRWQRDFGTEASNSTKNIAVVLGQEKIDKAVLNCRKHERDQRRKRERAFKAQFGGHDC